jgi:hypothetical protein
VRWEVSDVVSVGDAGCDCSGGFGCGGYRGHDRLDEINEAYDDLVAGELIRGIIDFGLE